MNFVSKTVSILAPGGDLSPPPRHANGMPAGASAGMNAPFGLGGQTGAHMLSGANPGMMHSASSGNMYGTGAPTVPMGGPMTASDAAGMQRAASDNQVMQMQERLQAQSQQQQMQQQASQTAGPGGSEHLRRTQTSVPTDQKPPRPPKKETHSDAAGRNEDKKDKANNLTSNRFSFFGGIRNRIADQLMKRYRTGKEAHMGKKSSFVYDKERGRWVIPGEEMKDEDDVPPPPPDDPGDENANDGGSFPPSLSYEDGMVSHPGGVFRTNSIGAYPPNGAPMFSQSLVRSQSAEDQISDPIGQPQMSNHEELHNQPQAIPNAPSQNTMGTTQGIPVPDQPMGMGGYGRMYPGSFNSTPDRSVNRPSSNFATDSGIGTPSESQRGSDTETMWSSENGENKNSYGHAFSEQFPPVASVHQPNFDSTSSANKTGNIVGGQRPSLMSTQSNVNSSSKSVSSGNNRFRAEKGRLSSRRAYVDPLHQGLNTNSTSVANATIRPNVPLPPNASHISSAPAPTPMQPSGVHIFRPQSMPVQQPQPSAQDNSNQTPGNPMGNVNSNSVSTMSGTFGYDNSNTNGNPNNVQSQDPYGNNYSSTAGSIGFSTQAKQQQPRKNMQPKMTA